MEEEKYIGNLAKRGKRYLEFAGNIFTARHRKMLDEWSKLYGNSYRLEDISRSERLSNLAVILMERYNLAARQYHLINERAIEDKRLLDNSSIYPRCYNHLTCPKHTMMIVLYKDYVPGKLICEGCGRPLETAEERDLEIQAIKALHGIKY